MSGRAYHIGGNRYLQGQTGCKIYSGGIEAAFTKRPVLEPSFLYGVGAYLETLDLVENMEAVMFVPAHAEASADIRELVCYNRDRVNEVAERIMSICKEPVPFEKILQEVFKGYGLAMNFEQHVLVGSTVRSYLSWLKDSGKLAVVFQDNMLLWQRV